MFQTPPPPKNNRLLWLRGLLAILAICAFSGAMVHAWHNAVAGLPVDDWTSLGLNALLLPALIVETLVYRGYVDRYIKYLDESDAVHRWRQWLPWTKKEDDDIVH